MSKYAITNGSSGQAVSSSYKSQIVVYASSSTQALRRGKVFDVLVGTNGVPADNYMQWDISRSTTTPTSGTQTALNTLDTADSSAAAIGIINLGSGEPTITSSSSLFNVGVNQRASYRWVAAPGSELVYPATAANGLALRVLSGGYTGIAASTLLVEEQ